MRRWMNSLRDPHRITRPGRTAILTGVRLPFAPPLAPSLPQAAGKSATTAALLLFAPRSAPQAKEHCPLSHLSPLPPAACRRPLTPHLRCLHQPCWRLAPRSAHHPLLSALRPVRPVRGLDPRLWSPLHRAFLFSSFCSYLSKLKKMFIPVARYCYRAVCPSVERIPDGSRFFPSHPRTPNIRTKHLPIVCHYKKRFSVPTTSALATASLSVSARTLSIGPRCSAASSWRPRL